MDQRHIYFGSGQGKDMGMLSNFASFDIRVDPASMPYRNAIWQQVTHPLVFPSTEHVWQAMRAKNLRTLMRFTTTGDLGSWNPVFFGENKDNEAQRIQKMNYWRTRNLIGIIAKMAATPKNAGKFNLDPKGADMHYGRMGLDEDLERRVWIWLLTLKYTQNQAARQALLATGNKTLVEFDRSARRKAGTDKPAYWGGLVSDDGLSIIGENKMGQYVQAVRSILQQ